MRSLQAVTISHVEAWELLNGKTERGMGRSSGMMILIVRWERLWLC